MLEQRLYTEAQHLWLLKLCNYKFQVEYKKGAENKAVEALSRRKEDEDPTLMVLSVVKSNWMNLVREMVQNDQYF